MSIIIELISLILQQLQQAFFEFEFSEARVDPSEDEACAAECTADPKGCETSAAENGWLQTDVADTFLFNHASLEGAATGTISHDARLEDATIYDRIVAFLMFGDSEGELAAMKMEFDLSFSPGNTNQFLAFEL